VVDHEFGVGFEVESVADIQGMVDRWMRKEMNTKRNKEMDKEIVDS